MRAKSPKRWTVRLEGTAGDAYRFTVKLMALLVPAEVATVTVAAPMDALAGTLHLICVALHER